MDGNRFDALIKTLAERRSRRGVLVGAAAAAAGVSLLAVPDGADARHSCRNGGEVCRRDGDCCGGSCAVKDASGTRRCTCATVALSVDASNPSPVDTGLSVAAGERVRVTTTGTSSWCCGNVDANGSGPCGVYGIPFNCGSVAAAVGAGNDIFANYAPFVPLHAGVTSFTAAASGEVVAQYVDGCPDCYGDNGGSLNLTVTTCL